MRIANSIVQVCVLATVALLAATSLPAQQPAPHPRHVITEIQTLPSGSTSFEDLIRAHVLPAVKEAGSEIYTWRTASLGNPNRYAIISPVESMSQFDSPAGWTVALGEGRTARFFSQIRPHIDSVQRTLEVERHDLSHFPTGKFNMRRALLVEATARPGMQPQMEKMLSEQVVPAFTEMKRGFASNQVSIGGNPNQWAFLIQIDKFADLEGGPFLLRHWGPEKYATWSQEVAGYLTHEVQYSIVELMPELSVMPQE